MQGGGVISSMGAALAGAAHATGAAADRFAHAAGPRGMGLRSAPVADCTVGVTDSTDLLLVRLSRVVRDNALAVAVCGLILAGCALAVAYVVWQMVAAVRSYRKLVNNRAAAPPPKPPRDEDGDDFVYTANAKARGLADLPEEAEADAVRGRLSAIKGRYAAYNKAISQYLRGKGRPTEGQLMDDTILSRKHD